MSEYTSTSYSLDSTIDTTELASLAGLSTSGQLASRPSTMQNVAAAIAGFKSCVENLDVETNLLSTPYSPVMALQRGLEYLDINPLLGAAAYEAAPALFNTLKPAILASKHQPTLELPKRSVQRIELSGVHILPISDSPEIDLQDAVRELDGAVHNGGQRLLVAEAALLRTKAEQSLQALGYRIRRPRRPQSGCVLVEGSQPQGCAITLEIVPEKGSIQLDLSGFCGDTCSRERSRLFNELRKRGVQLEIRATDRHGRFEGSSLTARFDRVRGLPAISTNRPVQQKGGN